MALIAACVHGASLAENGAHRALTPRKLCLSPCPLAEGPWGCFHTTSVGARGMERLQPWEGYFAFSPLPCTRDHPCSPASCRWKYRLVEPGRGRTTEDHVGAVLDGGTVQASSQSPEWAHKQQ